MLLFIQSTGLVLRLFSGFNTSHVVIYHVLAIKEGELVRLFQYISCCYLSRFRKFILLNMMSFNTSHVVIYLSAEAAQYAVDNSFNTSHVVIYQPPALLLDSFSRFQYISCCYLSRCRLLMQQRSTEFQYISCCYLSWRSSSRATEDYQVSIHLMLLFIRTGATERLMY